MPEWSPTLHEPDGLREFFLAELHMNDEKAMFADGWSISNDFTENKLKYLQNLSRLFPYLFYPILDDFNFLRDNCAEFAITLRLKLGFNNYSRFEYVWRKELNKAFKNAAQAHFGKENFP